MAVGPAKQPPANISGLQSDSNGYTRLHITPLDSELLSVVIPAATLPQARNISYHSLETFPDRRYGFVDLPTTDAERLRQKLNGATLKGTKMRIEQARPESIPQPLGADADDGKSKSEKGKREKKSKDRKEGSKKRKRTGANDVVEGVQLEDRKIKRGWTVTESDKIQEKRKEKTKKSSDKYDKKDKKAKKEKKREVKSKYTDGPECLFKQKLPESPSTKERDDEDADGHRRKRRKGDRQVTIHEFEKTAKYPSFLKSTSSTAASEPLIFEDGKGWVDANGNVVEAAKSKRPTFSNVSKPQKRQKAAPAPVQDTEDETSSSGSSSEDDSDSDAGKAVATTPSKKAATKPTSTQEKDDDTSSSDETSSSDDDSDNEAEVKQKVTKAETKKNAKPAPPQGDDDDTSSSDSSSSDGDSEEEEDGEKSTKLKLQSASKKLQVDTQPLNSPISSIKADSARPRSSGSATSLTIKIPPVTPAAAKVHPLEALYKRPQGATATPGGTAVAESKPFSFFDNDDIEDDEVAAPAGSQNPMTPYTKQDFEFRNVRSAAPTPDTAHPTRSYNLWPRTASAGDAVPEEDEDEDEMDEDTPMADAPAAASSSAGAEKGEGDKSQTSEFQKWFWDNRGDLNRSWKKRRKTASKEKRNRENRARAARAI